MKRGSHVPLVKAAVAVLTKHRLSGWDPSWLENPKYKPWLYKTDIGMFCRICRQHKQPASRGTSTLIFIECPGQSYRKDKLDAHMASDHHKTACQRHADLVRGGPGHRLYCRSHRIIDEMLEILASVTEKPILRDIQASQAVGLEVDESTDVSVVKQLDVHVRYLDKEGKLYCQFLDLVPIADGQANTIVAAVREVVHKKEIPTQIIFGLGTDCNAAVMTDASEKVPYMKTFKEHLQQLHLYFRNGANRTAALKSAAEALGISKLKVKAIQNLQRNISAVLGVLAEEVEVHKCPAAKGLYSFLAAYRFIAALHLQADVLLHLARFSKVFQREDVNFLAIKGQVMDPYLDGLKSHLEGRFHDLDVLAAFSVLGPQAARSPNNEAALVHLKTLAEKFPSVDGSTVVEEWTSFKQHVVTGTLQGKTQLAIMQELTSKYEEFGVLYPNLNQLAAIALTAPISSVNCERDFSAMNRVKTDLRNRLQGEHMLPA
ncbi:hypothetical protein SKAU_G00234220 [Synaphobranchus kaupii]|uniref:HAT C-terminal dimerisation domain-containing protein n=1 Tax=Synaphobranchus kaupii TaxID=118154 RepID=A0A9Q1F699_SYNKA|nr:hypothetical protein SKAU_G00234220 [Synaphobranchus kaupii]